MTRIDTNKLKQMGELNLLVRSIIFLTGK